MRLSLEEYEELSSVCIWTTVCHRKDTRFIMCQLEILICNPMKASVIQKIINLVVNSVYSEKLTSKLPSIDTFTTGSYKPIRLSLNFSHDKKKLKKKIVASKAG